MAKKKAKTRRRTSESTASRVKTCVPIIDDDGREIPAGQWAKATFTDPRHVRLVFERSHYVRTAPVATTAVLLVL